MRKFEAVVHELSTDFEWTELNSVKLKQQKLKKKQLFAASAASADDVQRKSELQNGRFKIRAPLEKKLFKLKKLFL